jgi:ADP-ribosylglycohydrolase
MVRIEREASNARDGPRGRLGEPGQRVDLNHGILEALGAGQFWQSASGSAFGDMGSMGNGGALGVAPLGACWADAYDAVVEQARASAEAPHAHPGGQAGAIAIAVAAAWAARWGAGEVEGPGRQLLEVALEYTPPGETRRGL